MASKAYQRTLVLVKPDALQRGLAGEILLRLERRGLKFVGLKLMRIDRPLAERHYAEHAERCFYDNLIDYITSGPVIAAVFSGLNAIDVVRATVGLTHPLKAAPGTIRGDLALELGRNLIHASDKPESAEREVNLFFGRDELLQFERDSDRWISEKTWDV